MNLLKTTSLAIITAATLGTSISASADDVSVNRVSAHTGSTWGTNMATDLTGITGLVAFDDRYVLEVSHSDVDLGLDIDGLDTTLTTVKLGLGSQREKGYLYYYLGVLQADISLGGESDSADAWLAGASWIGKMRGNTEVGFDIGLIKPEDGSLYGEFMTDINYFVSSNFGVGVYGSIDTEGEGQYGLVATYKF